MSKIHSNAELIRSAYNSISASDELIYRLNDMRSTENTRKKTKSAVWRTAAAAVLFLVFVTGVYAGTRKWSFESFYNPGEIPETAKEIVNTIDEGGDTHNSPEESIGKTLSDDEGDRYENIVSFTPLFTVADANMVYVGFEAEVSEDTGYLLIPFNVSVDSKIRTISDNLTEEDTDASIKDYCLRHDIKIVQVEGLFYNDDVVEMGSSRGVSTGTGKAEILLKGRKKAVGDELNVTVIYRSFMFDENTGGFALISEKEQELGVPEDLRSETATYGFEDGKEHMIGDTGILIKSVVLNTTQLATYTDIMIKNEDDRYGNRVSVHLVDENGDYYAPGPSYSGEAGRADASGWFSSKEDLKRFDTMPETIYVKAHNLPLSDEDVEVGTIELHRID